MVFGFNTQPDDRTDYLEQRLGNKDNKKRLITIRANLAQAVVSIAAITKQKIPQTAVPEILSKMDDMFHTLGNISSKKSKFLIQALPYLFRVKYKLPLELSCLILNEVLNIEDKKYSLEVALKYYRLFSASQEEWDLLNKVRSKWDWSTPYSHEGAKKVYDKTLSYQAQTLRF